MVFPVVMYACESWTIKKVEHRKTDAFDLWCWRRFSRVSLTARRSNQSILKEINPEYSLEGLSWSWSSNTYGTWCKGLTHLKRPWCWEKWGQEKGMTEDVMDGWMASPTQWTWVWANSGDYWRTGKPGVLESMGSQRDTWLSKWTTASLRSEETQDSLAASGYRDWGVIR